MVASGDLETLGAGTDQAGCQEIVTESAEGSNDHREIGTDIVYQDAPPAFGPHYNQTAGFQRKYYSTGDRPDIEYLVHNLEHGYNVLWYDDTVVEDTKLLDELRLLAESYDGAERDPDTALIATPWTAEDGAPFPDGMSYALTHWYADPADRTRSRADERAVTTYCAGLSPDVVQEWMEDYPLQHAPEGFRANMWREHEFCFSTGSDPAPPG